MLQKPIEKKEPKVTPIYMQSEHYFDYVIIPTCSIHGIRK